MLKALFGIFGLAVLLIVAANSHEASEKAAAAEAALTPRQRAEIAAAQAVRRAADNAIIDNAIEAGRVKRQVAKTMRDPASPRWGSVVRGRDGAWCGEVSSKNGFGAYTGMVPFIYRPTQNEVIMLNLTPAKWKKYCK